MVWSDLGIEFVGGFGVGFGSLGVVFGFPSSCDVCDNAAAAAGGRGEEGEAEVSAV